MLNFELINDKKFNINIKKSSQIFDLYLGNYYIIETNDNSEYLRFDTVFQNLKESNKLYLIYSKLIQFKIDNLILPMFYNFINNKSFCYDSYKLELIYNNYQNSLYNSVLKSKKQMDMQDLTHLLYQISLVNQKLNELSIFNCIITPYNIFIINKKYCLFENIIVPDKFVLIRELYLNINKDIYFSQELIDYCINKDSIKYIDFSKADVFSLGLIILELGLLINIQNIYINNRRNIDFVKLNYYVNLFKNKFNDNQLLCTTLEKMLESNIEERPNFTYILSILPNYDLICEYFIQLNNGTLALPSNNDYSNNSINKSLKYDDSLSNISKTILKNNKVSMTNSINIKSTIFKRNSNLSVQNFNEFPNSNNIKSLNLKSKTNDNFLFDNSKTLTIDGKLYKEVEEVRTVKDYNGNDIKKIYLKYLPL